MDRNQIRLDLLKRLGRVPPNAELNTKGEIVDPRGRPLDIRGDDGGPATAAELKELEALVDDEVAKQEEAAAGERGALPKQVPGRGDLQISDDEPEAAGPSMVENDILAAVGAELGIDLNTTSAAQSIGLAQGRRATFFGGGDDGIQILTGGQRSEGGSVGFTPGLGSNEYPKQVLPAPAYQADRPPTPGSGAQRAIADNAHKIVDTRVRTEVFEGLSGAQQEMLPLIFEEASRHGVDVALLFALLYQESRLNPSVTGGRNSDGSYDHGIAQINDRTLAGMNKDAAWAKDPRNAIAYAARRLAGSIKKYGSVAAALIEYNGGASRADSYLQTGRWPYERAEGYVKTILDVAADFNPSGVYDVDGPDPSTELPRFSTKVTNPTDIKARAREVGKQILGRGPNKEEMKLIIAAVQNGQQSAQVEAQYAAWVADEGMGGHSSAEWANYENGRIPQEAMAPIGGGHFLRPDAAAAWQQMTAAAARDGVSITLTDSYRDFATQVETARKKGLYSQGGLAATPGESNHGWGLAVDVDKGREWLAKNAHKFGFSTIAREPWHWEYKGDKKWTGGAGGAHVTDMPNLDNVIAEELEELNPQEAMATKFANSAGRLLEILDRGNPYRSA